MTQPDLCLREFYLQPGESRLLRGPAILRTVLGSCVGITFWARRIGCGALCHPMLPSRPVTTRAGLSTADGARYVDFAIRDLARQFDSLGILRRDVAIKLFGGGDVLLVPDGATRPTVGALNCEMALRVLADEGFCVAASSLGGTSGLHIQFNTASGEVRLRRLNDESSRIKGHTHRRSDATEAT